MKLTREMEKYLAERFEHYRAMGEDNGDAYNWAYNDTMNHFTK